MAIRNTTGALLLTIILSACAMPQSHTQTGTLRPTLSIIGAPAGSTLRVDGIAMGDANQYDGRRQVLDVEEGLHSVEVQSHGQIIYQAKVYAAGGETSRVEVGAASQ